MEAYYIKEICGRHRRKYRLKNTGRGQGKLRTKKLDVWLVLEAYNKKSKIIFDNNSFS